MAQGTWHEKADGTITVFRLSRPYFNINEAKPCQQASVVYAGALHVKKNPFLITLSQKLKTWHLTINGNKAGLHDWADNPCIEHKGFVASDEFIHTVNADFGLVWDGDMAPIIEKVLALFK